MLNTKTQTSAVAVLAAMVSATLFIGASITPAMTNILV